MSTQKIPTYYPIVYKLPDSPDKKANKIIDNELSPVLYNTLPYPQFNLGFHHYIHSNKDKMDLTTEKDIASRKKHFYYVANPFENIIDNYDKSMTQIATKYFELDKSAPPITDLSFFKFWEMIVMFDLIPTNMSNFISVHIADPTGESIRGTILYRNKFIEKKYNIDGDNYYNLILKKGQINKYVGTIDPVFLKYYPNIYTIDDIKSNMVNKVHFITADGGIGAKRNLEEQEYSKLIFTQITNCIKMQAVGGNFICKFYETFTIFNIKLLCLLKSLYVTVYVYKPLTSRESDSERFIVCKNFKYDTKELKSLVENLDNTVNIINTSDKYLNDIYPTYTIPLDIFVNMIAINTEISNKQFVSINKIIVYIKENNYYGDKYHDYRNQQINANSYWTSIFFPPSKKELDTNKGFLSSIIDKIQTTNNKQIVKLASTVRLF